MARPFADLRAGDVLSYSAGSIQTGPEGFRKLVPKRRTMLEAAAARWPDLLDVLGERPTLFINTYPATIGSFTPGITVDTYLSPRVFSRALQLGDAGDHPVILLGQPLFVADVLLKHIAGGWPWPKTLMLWTGGYVMPRSLEQALEAWLAPHVETLVIVQYFGAAEVDAGCLMARERTDSGGLIYHPREDVEVDVAGEDLLLTLRSHDGGTIIERFPTGDLAHRHGDGWVAIGDAAGLINPMNGEGIDYGLESGMLASDLFLEDPGTAPERYDVAVGERFDGFLSTGRRFSFLIGHPWILKNGLRLAVGTEAIANILAAAQRNNVYAGIHCGSGAMAREKIEQGFQFVTILNDARLMTVGANAEIAAARGQ